MRLAAAKIRISVILTVFALVTFANAQTVVDKIVATVGTGAGTEVITLSDLRWQLALQPNVPLDPPSREDLNRALQLQINQRLFALEAQRLPRAAPTEDEINAKIAEIIAYFPSAAEFERRLKIVGFDSVKDDNFENLIGQRVAIDKYLDFRFRSFVVVTAEDEANYYRETFVPDFRRRNPGVIVPTRDEARTRIVQAVTEARVAQEIQTFLDGAKSRIEIVTVSEP